MRVRIYPSTPNRGGGGGGGGRTDASRVLWVSAVTLGRPHNITPCLSSSSVWIAADMRTPLFNRREPALLSWYLTEEVEGAAHA